MSIVTHLAAFLIGAGAGLAAYRYSLKRDPEKLEAWARAIKVASATAQSKLRK